MSAQVAADLRAAADVLERDGWCQGRSHIHDEDEGTDQWCAVGAVRHVVSDRWTHRRYDRAYRVLSRHFGLSPTVWNDAPGRTAEEVIAALRSAADHAEAEL